MERKLASIRLIEEVRPIVGADRICQYRIGGWWVVDGIGKYDVGDKVIYYEIDSFLPEKPEFEFLRKSSFKIHADTTTGFKIRTIRLKKSLSQGLITPVPFELTGRNIGDDVTSELGVKKYEPKMASDLAGDQAGPFPNEIVKTDELRVQNFFDLQVDPRGKRCFFTEKLDGSSITIFFNNGKFGVCSRNFELKTDESNATNAYIMAAKNLNLEEKLRNYGRNLALQGELIGSGMNGNIYKMAGRIIKFFTIQDLDCGRRLNLFDLGNTLFDLGLESAPILSREFILPAENFVDSMLAMAEGKSAINPTVDREGIVVRGLDEEFSFKAISNTYLLGEIN